MTHSIRRFILLVGLPLYVHLAPDALLAFDERGELLARVTDVDGRAALAGGKLSEP
jgi:hypothetical protein